MNNIATAFIFVFWGICLGFALTDWLWKRRIRSWRQDTLRKIEESRVRLSEVGEKHRRSRSEVQRAALFQLICDECDHERGLRGQVQGFENLLRYYGGMLKVDDLDRRQFTEDGHLNPRHGLPVVELEVPKHEDRFFASLKLERGPLGESCVVFDKPQPHSEGCTCDTCWPDDPVLYSNEALDAAVKNGAVLREGPIAYHEPTPVIDFDAIRALDRIKQAEKLSEWRCKVSEGTRELAGDLPSAALDPEETET